MRLPGKQARVANDDPNRRNDASPPNVPQAHRDAALSEPAYGAVAPAPVPGEAFSVGGPNKAAQAAQAAARAAEPTEKHHQGAKAGKWDEANIVKLVAEENENKAKFPKYPGLERWELVEKMGDGAFSNVYRARDRDGKAPGEVAIKVVRKYEMNNMQVSSRLRGPAIVDGRSPSPWPSISRVFPLFPSLSPRLFKS